MHLGTTIFSTVSPISFFMSSYEAFSKKNSIYSLKNLIIVPIFFTASSLHSVLFNISSSFIISSEYSQIFCSSFIFNSRNLSLVIFHSIYSSSFLLCLSFVSMISQLSSEYLSFISLCFELSIVSACSKIKSLFVNISRKVSTITGSILRPDKLLVHLRDMSVFQI